MTEKTEEQKAKHREAQRRYRERNREAVREKIRTCNRAYLSTEAGNAKQREYRRRYREKHPDRVKESARKCRETRADVIKESVRAYRATESGRAAMERARARWVAKNRDRVLAYYREYNAHRRAGRTAGEALADTLGMHLSQNAIYAAASAAVHRGMPPDVRDDILSMIVLAVLEGEFPVEEIAAQAKKFISAHYRQFSKFSTVSIDAVVPGTDNLRLIDTLAADDDQLWEMAG